jgi:hypothetical protein
MFTGAMDFKDGAAIQTAGLPRWRCLKWFAMRPEPGFDDAIALNPGMDTAGDRLYFGQFRHFSIVKGNISPTAQP